MNLNTNPFYIDNSTLIRAAQRAITQLYIDAHKHELHIPAVQYTVYKLTSKARVLVRIYARGIYVELYTKTITAKKFTYAGSLILGNNNNAVFSEHLYPYISYIAKTITNIILTNTKQTIEKSIRKSINYVLNDKGEAICINN